MTQWIRAAAEEIHDKLDEIEREASEAATIAQDNDAGYLPFVDAVAKIIAFHAARGMIELRSN